MTGHRRLLPALLLAAVPLLAPPPSAAGEDDPAAADAAVKEVKNVPDKEAKEALERFEREFDTQDIDLRLEAVQRLRRVIHPTVSRKLLDLGLRHEEANVRSYALRGLAIQKPSAKIIGPVVAKMLREEAEASRKAKARGDHGLVVDVKTGEVDTQSPEGVAALRKKHERGRMLAEAVRCLYHLDYRDRYSIETLLEFLQDGNDDLVALILETFGRWKEWTVLDEILDLWEIYPDEDSFQTGSVRVDTGAAGSADAARARAKWMALYGDPDKRRPRPKVVRAIQSAVKGITGEEMEKPADLREFMRDDAVKRKVRD